MSNYICFRPYFNLDVLNEVENRSGVRAPCLDCLLTYVCMKECDEYKKNFKIILETLKSIQWEMTVKEIRNM